jgi:hypothetical protein
MDVGPTRASVDSTSPNPPRESSRLFMMGCQGRIEVYELPPYCPSLHRIERPWGHLKQTILAYILLATMAELVAVSHKGLEQMSVHRQHLGFTFRPGGRAKRAA